MGDISMRGKGRALKMKKGGALPSTKGSSKAGMQSKQGRNFLLPKEPKPKKGRDPERPPKFGPKPKPMPKPMPRPDRGPDRKPKPVPRPMPMPMPPKIKEKIEQFMENLGKKARPAMKKDGGSAKKPDSARGKSTRIGKIKKVVENIKKRGNVGRPSMSPGKQKAIFGTKKVAGPAPFRRKQGTRSLQSLMAGSALKGAGKMGAGMAGQAMKLAKKLKPTGRLNADDLKRAKEMLLKKKGK